MLGTTVTLFPSCYTTLQSSSHGQCNNDMYEHSKPRAALPYVESHGAFAESPPTAAAVAMQGLYVAAVCIDAMLCCSCAGVGCITKGAILEGGVAGDAPAMLRLQCGSGHMMLQQKKALTWGPQHGEAGSTCPRWYQLHGSHHHMAGHARLHEPLHAAAP